MYQLVMLLLKSVKLSYKKARLVMPRGDVAIYTPQKEIILAEKFVLISVLQCCRPE